jgi:hypothetical protein
VGGTVHRLARIEMVMLAMLAVTIQAAVATASTPLAQDSSADRPLHVVFESAVYNAETGNVDFTVEFDRPPKFRKADEFGRPADSFQYFIFGDATLPYPQNFDAIIRGDELELDGSRVLPIRNSAPPDPDPAAGGWGTIRATVHFKLHGRVLTFSAALSVLNDHSTDGRFTYVLETYNFGSVVDSILNESIVPSQRPRAKLGLS